LEVRGAESLSKLGKSHSDGNGKLQRRIVNQLVDPYLALPSIDVANRGHQIAEMLKDDGIVMPEIDYEDHLAGNNRRRIRKNVELANGKGDGAGVTPHRFLQRIDGSTRTSQGIAAQASWRRAGVAFLADDFDTKCSLALDTGNDTRRVPLLL